MRAIIYLRQSQDRTGQQFGVGRQRKDAQSLAQLRDWTVVMEVVDNDVSASGRRARPGFARILEALRRREVDAVVAWDMTRLTRNARDTFDLMTAGTDAGATLSFVRGSDLHLSTADGRTMAGILASIAQGEIDKKAERQERAAEQAAEKGMWIGGRRPFGFEPDGMTVRQVEAKGLQDAYAAVLKGDPLSKVAKKLNGAGLLTPQTRRNFEHGCAGKCGPTLAPRLCPSRMLVRVYEHGCSDRCGGETDAFACPSRVLVGDPSPWSAQTLRSTLLNPRYAGLRSRVTKELRAGPLNPQRARLEGVCGKAAWPAIVDEEEVWTPVKRILLDPSRTKAARSGQALLTGVARCGAAGAEPYVIDGRTIAVCGAPVHRGGAAPKPNGKPGYPTYRCRNALGHIGRVAELVDEHIGDLVVVRLSASDAEDLLGDDERPDFDHLQRELREIRTRMDGLANLLAEGMLPVTAVRREATRLRTRADEIEADLADDGRASLRPIIEAADIRAAWTALDTDAKRHIISVLFDVIVLLPPGRGRRLTRETVDSTIEWTLASFARTDCKTGAPYRHEPTLAA